MKEEIIRFTSHENKKAEEIMATLRITIMSVFESKKDLPTKTNEEK